MNLTPITWQVIAHTIVGMTIAGCLAIAGAFPSNATIVAYCHIISAIIVAGGVGIGVWNGATISAERRAMKLQAAPEEKKAA